MSAYDVPELLLKAADKYKERNLEYGDSFVVAGDILDDLFPNKLKLNSATDHLRYHMITWIVGKLTRYCSQFNTGGHPDSIHDMVVYCAMLEAIDAKINKENS